MNKCEHVLGNFYPPNYDKIFLTKCGEEID